MWSDKGLVGLAKLTLLVALLAILFSFVAIYALPAVAEEPKSISFAVTDSSSNPVQNALVEMFVSDSLDGEYVLETSALTGADGSATISTNSLTKYAYFDVSKVGYDFYWPDETLGQYSLNLDGYVILASSIDNSADINVVLDTFPAIWTGRENYNPEEVVDIYGTGFDFDKYPNIQIKVTAPNGGISTQIIPVSSTGEITVTYPLDGIQDVYTVEAFTADGTTLLTSTTFMDDLDPTVIFNATNSNPMHDTYAKFNDGISATNDNSNLHVKWGNNNNDRRRSYLKFNISSIPIGATINSATLHLYQFGADNGGNVKVSKVSNNYASSSTPWTEEGLNYNNAPTDFSTGVQTSVNNNDGFKSLSVATSDVQTALSNGVLSLAVRISPESGDYHHDFCDKEETGNSCHSLDRPYLEVSYTTPAVCGNGQVEGTEQCDDGNTSNGDCCSSTCQYELSSTVCKASGGVCDPVETCTGSSATCPADAVRPNGYVCAQESGQCDADDTCDGTTKNCNEIYASQGTSCDDVFYCNGYETCDGSGNCQSGTAVSCSDNNIAGIARCDNDPDLIAFTWDYRAAFTSTCDESNDICPTGSETITHTCNKATCSAECETNGDCPNKCVNNVFSSNGACQGNCVCSYTTQPCDDQDICTTDSCSPTGGCTHTPIPNCCDSDSECNDNNVCTNDACMNNQCQHTNNNNDCGTCAICSGGSCVADLTQNNDCSFCQKCTAKDTCGMQSSSEDVKNECPSGDCVTGLCNGAGACGNQLSSTPCEKDGHFCTVDHCDGNGACVFWKNYDCSSNDITGIATCNNIPDNNPFTFDFRTLFTSQCIEDGSNTGHCTTGNQTITNICADANSTDGGPAIPVGDGIRACTAECDSFGTECQNKCIGNVRYYSGSCNLTSCGCSYTTENCDLQDNCYVYQSGCEDRNYFCAISGCDYTYFNRNTDYSDEFVNYCSADTVRKHKQSHDFSCDGSCIDHTSWVNDTLVQDCSLSDGWYDTGATRWVDSGACNEKEQEEQNYMDYGCSAAVCTYANTSTQWLDTGSIRHKTDTSGPVVTNIVLKPNPAGGSFCIPNITATATENCTNISEVRYWFDTNCSIGSGNLMNAVDGSFDELVEDVEVNNMPLPQNDGGHNLYVRAKNADGYWGACVGVPIEIDRLPPGITNRTIENAHWVDASGYWICADDGILTGTLCDMGAYYPQSNICEAEYVIDYEPTFGDGYPMDPLDGIFGDDTCEGVNGTIINSDYTEGRHWTQIRGHDCACNWGKDLNVPKVWFIIDRTPPQITKTVGQPSVSCGENCDYITKNTNITLNCEDVNPGDGYYSDDVTIFWRYQINGGQWYNFSSHSSSATFKYPEDSNHTLEYWCVDACGHAEDKHTEIDIVDTQAPVTVKTITGPQVAGTGSIDEFITRNTTIELNCTDPAPHPVDQVTLYWDLYWSQNCDSPSWTKIDDETTNGYKLITGLNDSCHKIVYHCEDALGNAESNITEIDAVDNTPPVGNKDVGQPNIPCELNGLATIGQVAPECFWVQDNVTKITMNCVDQNPHPVGGEMVCYRVSFDIPEWHYITGQYCNVTLDQDGWCCVNNSKQIIFQEDSVHDLEYYCVDALGNNNKNAVDLEYFKVDSTPPVTVKTYGQPLVEPNGAGTYPKWINSSTPITLTATDGGAICHVGVNQTYYKYDVVDDSYCLNQSLCQGLPSIDKAWDTASPQLFNIPEDSCHLIEYYSVDLLGNAEAVKKQCVYVDNKPPVSTKTLGDPKHACTPSEQIEYYGSAPQTDGCYFITQNTPITLTCADQNPHPVDHVQIKYKDWVVGNTEPGWTVVSDDHVTIYKTEDSAHILEWYCVDALGNTESTHVEYDIVDTQAPETTKTVGTPKVAGDNNPINWYITKDTTIDLTCTDGQPHPSDHVNLYWDVYYSQSCDTPSWTKIDGGIAADGHKIITGLSDSCHKIVYHCVDALGNAETEKVEIDAVDNQAPSIVKTIDGPSYGQCPPRSGTSDVCFIDGVTKINVTAVDQEPHPVNDVSCYWWYYVNETRYPSSEVYRTFPITFPEESEHVLHIKCKDALDNEAEDIETFLVDHTPPVTTKTYGTPFYTNNVSDWITSDTPITLTVEDAGPHKSGIKQTKYRVTLVPDVNCYETCSATGSGDWLTYSSPFTINEDSCHIIEYFSVDNVDKTEITKKQCVFVDNTPPLITKIDGEPKIECDSEDPSECDYWVRDHVTPIDLYCSDVLPHPVDHVKLWYRILLDGNVTQEWTDPAGGGAGGGGESQKQIIFTEDSVHTLQYYCEDALGNSDGTRDNPHKQVYRVDSTPPESTKTIIGPQYVKSTYIQGLNWTDVIWVTSDTNFTITSVDKQEPCAVGIDHLYVKVEWDSDCNGYVDTPLSEVIITQAPFEYKFQLGEECLHKITWYAVDKLGNNETVHVQYHKVDNTPPHVLILKPVDGWYSDGEDIAVVAIAEDLTDPHGQCDMYSGMCSVGIADGTPCGAYFIDLLPDFAITPLESHMTYNAEAHECQGYVTIPEESGIPDGIVILAVTPQDNLGNEGDSLWEIYHTIQMNCGESPVDECIMNVVESIVAVWNLPKIGIDNTAPVVDITAPVEGSTVGQVPLFISADVSDGDGVTSTIITGTPCYVTLDDINIATLYYTANDDKCKGTILIPLNSPQGNQLLKVEIADNAGNLGSDSISVHVDTTGSSGNEPENSDIKPPVIIYSNPSDVINYSDVVLEIETDESAACYYGTEDNLSAMSSMATSGANTTHIAELGTLLDGLHVYHVQCQDNAGNWMDSSKTIVFYIDTSGLFKLTIPDYGHYWSTGWNTFFLPKTMLNNICGECELNSSECTDGGTYYVEDVLSSLDGSDPSFDVVWYFDGNDWLFYVPGHLELSTLREFNDEQSLPYYIKMNSEGRLEITQNNCPAV